jgi:hypothetical protein
MAGSNWIRGAVTAAITLGIISPSLAFYPQGGCSSCARPAPQYYPMYKRISPSCCNGSAMPSGGFYPAPEFPSVHPGVPYGYYPTQWQPFNAANAFRSMPPAPKRRVDEPEPLPPPRPIEKATEPRIIIDPAQPLHDQ